VTDLRPVRYDEEHPLVRALSAEMAERYGDGDASHPADPAGFGPPHGVFLVAAVDGEEVACGGVRLLLPGIGEVKRMYVAPAHRNRGLARALLKALVEHARVAGLGELWLETGTAQPEAITLYLSEGFVPVPPYGQYRDHPDSRCYALRL